MSKVWLAIGFTAQAIFFGRWVIQWIATERNKKSTIPIAFWYLSLMGGVMLLAYAIYRKDPVFILGQSVGAIIYLRNLYYIQTHKKESLPGD